MKTEIDNKTRQKKWIAENTLTLEQKNALIRQKFERALQMTAKKVTKNQNSA